MGISSETPLPADKVRAPHRVRLLIGRAICWFTDPVIEERRRTISLPHITAEPTAVIPANVDPAHLPIFSNGRRPPFFYDAPVRDRLICCLHRMTVDQARELCILEFGVKRTPSRSAIHRFWQKLDADESFRPVVDERFEAAIRKLVLDRRAARIVNPTPDSEPVNPWQPQPKGRIERAHRRTANGGAA